jgi:cytochrome b
LAQSHTTASSSSARTNAPAMVVVWDWPLRLFHWVLAASVLIAWFTPNAYDTVHRIAGYTVLGLIAFRLVWGFTGSRYSRFHNLVRLSRAAPVFLWGVTRGQTGRYLGLNPAGAAMSVALLLSLTVSTISGWMSVTVRFFGVPWVESLHTTSSDLVIVLVIVHVLGVLTICVLQKENLVRAMINGRKRDRGES